MSYIGNQPAPTNIPIANLDGVTATNTELNHVDGVTSAIQTQVDTKTTAGFAVAMAIAL